MHNVGPPRSYERVTMMVWLDDLTTPPDKETSTVASSGDDFVVDCVWIVVASWYRRTSGSSGVEDRLLEVESSQSPTAQRAAETHVRVVNGRPARRVTRGCRQGARSPGTRPVSRDRQHGIDCRCCTQAGSLCRYIKGTLKPRRCTTVYWRARLERGSLRLVARYIRRFSL